EPSGILNQHLVNELASLLTFYLNRAVGLSPPPVASHALIYIYFTVILPVKTHSSNFVSIFDLRTKRFLCMDRKGELFNSDTEDCLFQRLWLDWPNKHDVFYSTRFSIAKRELSEISADVGHKLQQRMLKRQKRSKEVNPYDPFQSEAHPHPPQPPQEPDQSHRDQTGAVSKETIPSCDDPLKVLQNNGPGSPVKNNIGIKLKMLR
uniref:Uncharacterized protein n=1 Tax=Neogobius melanostomus TaxID=47308 RepID=A0A8C6SUC5_9GOBI